MAVAATAVRRAVDLFRRVRLYHCVAAPPHHAAVPTVSRLIPTSNPWSLVRRMSSDAVKLPHLSDARAKDALNALWATNWSKIDKDVRDAVRAVISKGGADADVLAPLWSSAQASEKFAQSLIYMRMELDDQSGADGETVRKLPDTLVRALESAFIKYTKYLGAIDDENELFLRKKVENDLGSLLIQLKQRCSGLDAKWGEITLLGTSGLSGSYIERRGKS